jgi:hypothetical protein
MTLVLWGPTPTYISVTGDTPRTVLGKGHDWATCTVSLSLQLESTTDLTAVTHNKCAGGVGETPGRTGIRVGHHFVHIYQSDLPLGRT